jgi:hypothetical protein
MTDASRSALLAMIRERLPQDPLVGAKVGAAEVKTRLLEVLASPRGVQVESLLAVAGALAGQAAQAGLKAMAQAEGCPPVAPFQTVRTQDGRLFVVGEGLSRVLAAEPYSLWGLAAGEAMHIGCLKLPDLGELFAYGIKSLGHDHFGKPLVPDHHQPNVVTLQWLSDLWPALFPLAREFCPSATEWPILFSLVAQQVIRMSKGVIDPCLALRIVMDTGIAGSKVLLPSN